MGYKTGSGVDDSQFNDAWDGSELAPSQNAIYDLIVEQLGVSNTISTFIRNLRVNMDAQISVAENAAFRIKSSTVSVLNYIVGRVTVEAESQFTITSNAQIKITAV